MQLAVYCRALCFALFACLSSQLFADKLTVSSLNDQGSGSLRQSVFEAQTGDTILFGISGQILLDSQIVIDKSLHILGPGAQQLALSGGMQTRLLLIDDGDTVHISGLSLQDGNVYSQMFPAGGAIVNYGFLTLRDCYLHHNQAGYGGAIVSGRLGITTVLELYNCSFAYNTALDAAGNPAGIPEAGGAIYIDGANGGSADVDAWNCTFAHNRSDLTGGAVFLTGEGALSNQTSFEATNCSFVYNQSLNVGAIAYQGTAVVRLRNSLLAQNEAGIPHLEGSLKSFGYNLIDNSLGLFFAPNGQAEPSDILDVEAGVSFFGLNGGSIPVVPVACSSPAIDAGDDNQAPPTDARGQNRNGVSDIGAYEFFPTDVVVSNLQSAGPGSLPQAIQLACPDDTLRLDGLTGKLHLTSTIVLNKNLSILGNPLDDIYLEGGDSIRLFQVAENVSVYFRWFNFVHGGPANYGGGAMQNNGTLSIAQSSFAHNQARSGGAIANYGLSDTARLFLSNCTFSGNQAIYLDGGAIDNRFIDAPAFVSLTHCTFADNLAASKGGALYLGSNTGAESVNSLFVGNDAPEGPEIYGTMRSLGHNLIQNDADLSLQADNDLINVSATLDPLALYGGPTLTHRLPIGSLAINAGLALPGLNVDQRGENRVFNGSSDIGAYEYNPATRITADHNAVFHLYPNPSQGQFWLQWDSDVPRTAVLIIRDSQGKTLLQQALQGAKHEVRLPASLSAGVYFVELLTDSGRYTQKIMIE